MLAATTVSATGILGSLLFFFFFILLNPFPLSHANGLLTEQTMVPLIEAGKSDIVTMSYSRRKLNGFKICSLCTCCGKGGNGKYCAPSPCCYAINCNIPNRPFGFCAFTPKTCNCFGCHL